MRFTVGYDLEEIKEALENLNDSDWHISHIGKVKNIKGKRSSAVV